MTDYKCKKCGEPREHHDEDGMFVIRGCKACRENIKPTHENASCVEAAQEVSCIGPINLRDGHRRTTGHY